MGAQLWGGLIFGALGMGYWTYGRRQQDILAQICAAAMVTLPFFVPSAIGMIATGLFFCVVPIATARFIGR